MITEPENPGKLEKKLGIQNRPNKTRISWKYRKKEVLIRFLSSIISTINIYQVRQGISEAPRIFETFENFLENVIILVHGRSYDPQHFWNVSRTTGKFRVLLKSLEHWWQVHRTSAKFWELLGSSKNFSEELLAKFESDWDFKNFSELPKFAKYFKKSWNTTFLQSYLHSLETPRTE